MLATAPLKLVPHCLHISVIHPHTMPSKDLMHPSCSTHYRNLHGSCWFKILQHPGRNAKRTAAQVHTHVSTLWGTPPAAAQTFNMTACCSPQLMALRPDCFHANREDSFSARIIPQTPFKMWNQVVHHWSKISSFLQTSHIARGLPPTLHDGFGAYMRQRIDSKEPPPLTTIQHSLVHFLANCKPHEHSLQNETTSSSTVNILSSPRQVQTNCSKILPSSFANAQYVVVSNNSCDYFGTSQVQDKGGKGGVVVHSNHMVQLISPWQFHGQPSSPHMIPIKLSSWTRLLLFLSRYQHELQYLPLFSSRPHQEWVGNLYPWYYYTPQNPNFLINKFVCAAMHTYHFVHHLLTILHSR